MCGVGLTHALVQIQFSGSLELKKKKKKKKMIFVDGHGILFSTSSTSSSPNQERQDLVYYLLQHPTLISSSESFKATPLFHLRTPPTLRNQNHVYVFQREYATVDPALVQLLGTDEATTCVGVVIRNNKSGMTSVSHMDSPHVVDLGLTQMLSLLIHHNLDAELDVHLIGAYDDTLLEVWRLQHNNGMSTSESNAHLDSHSFPLCSKLVEALQRRPEHFHIRTLFVLAHNTRIDSNRVSYPIVTGFVVETCTGTIAPANFDRSSRSPDEVIRRIRVTVSSGDPTWNGKLLETYDAKQDRFQIAACSWSPRWLYIAQSLQQLSDSEILLRCSTSPLAEGPDFVDNERRLFGYLIKHPNWKETFPARKPRIFERTADGGWRRC